MTNSSEIPSWAAACGELRSRRTLSLVTVSIAVLKHLTEKQVRAERVYSKAHTSILLFFTEGSQGRNLEAGADAETVEGGAVSWLVHPAFYRAQDHQPRDGTPHNGLGPPSITS